MGILDEAIREHLELKRQHGADDSELKQLEDDAFGPPRRPEAEEAMPDVGSEAATEFMAQPDLDGVEGGTESGEPPPERPARREPIADIQEAPERPAPADELFDGERLDEEPLDEEPAEEEQPAAEHEAVTPPPEPAGHSTEERHIIADQPTQMFDVESEFDGGRDAAAPSDEELIDEEEIAEPRLGPVEPVGAIDGGDEAEDYEDEEEDFFDEQRLSDELDQALDAPLEPESEELEYEDEEEEAEDEDDEEVSDEYEQPAASHGRDDEDVLEETPDFLEEAPEDDQLWFEQKPPKDFDFDD